MNGEEKELDLSSVFDIVVDEHELSAVQDYIKALYWGYEPSEFQLKIAKYNWTSIYSTNFNLIVERIYSTSTKKKQRLVPIYKVSDRYDSLVKPPEDLAYIKLHGCITKITHNDSQLLVSPDQYINHKKKDQFYLKG